MKKLLLLFILLSSFICGAKAQDQKGDPDAQINISPVYTETPDTGLIYAAVEKEPQFPGGQNKFNDYVQQFIKQHFPGIKAPGRSIVQFVVEKDGTLSSIHLRKTTDEALIDATYSIIINSPKWKPGTQNGHTVRVHYTVAIDFPGQQP